MKKVILGLLISVMMVMPVGLVMAKGGFDEFGYNKQARNFVGTGMSWCMGKIGNEAWCTAYLGPYANDKLVMKWNAEWDRGNAEKWKNPPYAAWEDNEWNGAFPNGSGAVWHYKIKWDQGCAQNGVPSVDGAYCIWGQFATIMDQGKDPSYGPGHIWFAHAAPNGYGN